MPTTRSVRSPAHERPRPTNSAASPPPVRRQNRSLTTAATSPPACSSSRASHRPAACGDLKELRRHGRELNGRCRAVDGDWRPSGCRVIDRGEYLEAAALIAPEAGFSERQRNRKVVALCVGLGDVNDAILVGHEWTQDHRVDDGEERCDRSNPETERQDRDCRGRTAASQRAKAEAEVAPETVDHLKSIRPSWAAPAAS